MHGLAVIVTVKFLCEGWIHVQRFYRNFVERGNGRLNSVSELQVPAEYPPLWVCKMLPN